MGTTPIVTEVTPFDAYYRAEDYHQNYFRDNGFQPYCQVSSPPRSRSSASSTSRKLKA
jgi:peptide-methionine (S)-S-oxide reductase